jgi:hypothetical protein
MTNDVIVAQSSFSVAIQVVPQKALQNQHSGLLQRSTRLPRMKCSVSRKRFDLLNKLQFG